MSDDLISRRALYERVTTLETQALDHVRKLIEKDDEETKAKWKIWSAILIERTAFKHDVYDAPSAQRTGQWIRNDNGTYYCSCCKTWITAEQGLYARYCLYCGAQMKVEK